MKVAILVMSTNKEPSLSNVRMMKDTLFNDIDVLSNNGKLNHSYDIYVYSGGSDTDLEDSTQQDEKYSNVFYETFAVEESIYRTFEKTIYSLTNHEYDFYIRINISCFLNIRLIDRILNGLKTDCIYCSAINSYIHDDTYLNDLYARGDMMIFSKSVRNKILENANKYMFCDTVMNQVRLNVEHVDDCLLGLCFIDGYGKDYYQHLIMLKYNFIPHYSLSDINSSMIDRYSVSNRVKTMPPNVLYSGYSWDDNEYRRIDGEKMKYIQNIYDNIDYSKELINNLIQKATVPKDKSRPTLFVQYSSQNLYTRHWEYLKNKRNNIHHKIYTQNGGNI